MDSIYGRIESLCRDAGINITALCRDCSIPRATLSDFKTGRVKSLSAAVLSKIAAYFSVSVDYLMEGHDSISQDQLKAALFGGDGEVTDAMWDEVKRYAEYIKEREHENRSVV